MRMLALAVCVTLMGCSDSSDRADNREDEESVFDPLVENIDKAKEVESKVMEHKDKLDQAVKDAGEDVPD